MTERLLAEIAKVTPQKVTHVVVTHYHADHVYGLQVFEKLGARIGSNISMSAGTGKVMTGQVVGIFRSGVRAEIQRIEREEAGILDALLKARQEAGLTQAQVAERMGTQAPAVARLERALATGKHSPSVATLRKYVKACGKRLVLRVA